MKIKHQQNQSRHSNNFTMQHETL